MRGLLLLDLSFNPAIASLPPGDYLATLEVRSRVWGLGLEWLEVRARVQGPGSRV